MKKIRFTFNTKRKTKKSIPIQYDFPKTEVEDINQNENPDSSIIKDKQEEKKNLNNKAIRIIPKVINKKLTIILLENTQKALDMKQEIQKIISRLVPDDYICVINYGSTVKAEKVSKVDSFNHAELLNAEIMSKETHFYDAFKTLEQIVSNNYLSIIKGKEESYKIKDIDIIGIGTGVDLGSTIDKELASYYFYETVFITDIETKYFCFTEDTVAEVAAIGFHSIGFFPSKSKE